METKTAKPNGGPAFPVVESIRARTIIADGFELHGVNSTAGMSLRDWFAGMALQGMSFGLDGQGYPKLGTIEGWPESELMATTAYALADAMLKARES